MRKVVMLLGCLLVVSNGLQAAQKTDRAEGLVDMCRFAVKDDPSGLTRDQSFEAGLCMGLFSGIMQLSGLYALVEGRYVQTFCLPTRDV